MQTPRHLQNIPSRQPFQIALVQLGERLERVAGRVNQPPNQRFFRGFQLPERGQLPRRDGGAPVDRRLTNLRPHDLFRNPGLVRDAVRELIARRGVRYSRCDGQHFLQKLSPVVIAPEIAACRRPIEEVL